MRWVAKSVHDNVLDGAFNVLQASTLMIACSAQPTTRGEAVTTFALADVAMTSVDFVKADDTSGRKVTMAAKSGITIDNSGTATHIALVDAANLLYVTTCTALALTAGNTVNFPTWKINIQDPT